MRILIDSLVAVMLAGVLAGVILHQRSADDDALLIEQTRESLTKIQNAMTIQVTLETVEVTPAGFPRTIDPAWFDGGVPENHLVTDDRPWMEVAGLDQHARMHPLTLVADEARDLAKFWYNPYNGIVRARVAGGFTDQALLDMYNAVNACQLRELVPTMRGQ